MREARKHSYSPLEGSSSRSGLGAQSHRPLGPFAHPTSSGTDLSQTLSAASSPRPVPRIAKHFPRLEVCRELQADRTVLSRRHAAEGGTALRDRCCHLHAADAKRDAEAEQLLKIAELAAQTPQSDPTTSIFLPGFLSQPNCCVCHKPCPCKRHKNDVLASP
ncbi:hypothetical protein PAL_GLEAN10006811 [Pteropus alecto]|uniref:Uncharacterized protein n=1 Tax=Pteropus alecto TaxID=9402 RepID=L5L4R9_PTEAL|nr:hypothetical protein PAL_GLEAN10006811 [Pteropus alecto]